ncbi:hypothetical protein D7X74_21355 [Corallococcus sp. CA047B]|uniref:hypothetical protein n=1 Tax=Corallococcus sp. CA047B TaxID=2316729 RepID=UPI000EA10677|nr:hypothetical protein [Corallococcus sp. CA047B]RKH13796.1 hypothetical protein D7X74_21355 [Corallococcus sp. CA047B]
MADTKTRRPEKKPEPVDVGRELTDEEAAAIDSAAWSASDESGRELTDDEMAELDSAAWVAEPQSVGQAKAGVLGFAQGGTLGFADEFGGLIGKAVLPESTVRLGAAAQPAPDDTPEVRAAKVDALVSEAQTPKPYALVRTLMRREADAAHEQHPKTYFGGQLAGGIASSVALPGGGARTLGQAVKSGAAMGAAQGLGESRAELADGQTSVGDVAHAAIDTTVGGAGGVGGAAFGYGVGKAAPTLVRWARSRLDNGAIERARRVLTNGADQQSKRLAIPEEVVREALDSGAIVPWGTTAGTAKRLDALADARNTAYGDILERLQQAGVQGPRAEELARQFASEAEDRALNSGANKSVARAFEAEAENVRNINRPEFLLLGESPPAVPFSRAPATQRPVPTPPPATSRLPLARGANGRFLPRAQQPQARAPAPPPVVMPSPPSGPTVYAAPVRGPMRSRLPLTQAERIKRALQKEARYGRYEETPINEAKKEIAATYREGIERAVHEAGEAAPPRSEVAELAEEFVPVKRQLARTLAAQEVATRGASRGAQRVGGAAGPSAFDVANAAQASGTSGLPAMALAAAGRVWKERGPSTLAVLENASQRGAGHLANYLQAAEGRGAAGATLGGATERSTLPSAFDPYVAQLFMTEEERRMEQQRAIAESLRRRTP